MIFCIDNESFSNLLSTYIRIIIRNMIIHVAESVFDKVQKILDFLLFIQLYIVCDTKERNNQLQKEWRTHKD